MDVSNNKSTQHKNRMIKLNLPQKVEQLRCRTLNFKVEEPKPRVQASAQYLTQLKKEKDQ